MPSSLTRWCSPSTCGGLGVTGYQATEYARAKHHLDFGSCDSGRVNARFTYSDDDSRFDRMVQALEGLVEDHDELDTPPEVRLPSPAGCSSRP